MAEVALVQITKRGRLLAIRRYGTQISNPVTGEVVREVVADGELMGVVLPANSSTVALAERDNDLQGATLIEERTRYILAAAKGAPFEPASLDEVAFDGATWQVMGCTPLSPAGIPLVYKMGVMRT